MSGSGLDLTVLVLSYNRADEVGRTLDRLRDLRAAGESFATVVVDNGSTDGTAKLLTMAGGDVDVVALAENEGIAAFEAGFQAVRTPYVLVLDDDSHPGPGCTTRCAELLRERTDVGVVACRVELADGERFSTWHLPEEDEAGESFSFVGCGFAVRRDEFVAAGGFWSPLFLYQNEPDLAMRYRRAGLSVLYEPSATVVHRVGSSLTTNPERRVFLPTRNSLLLIRRHFRGMVRAYMLGSRLCIGLAAALLHRSPRLWLRAAREGLALPVPATDGDTSVRDAWPFVRENSVVHLWRHLKKVFP